MFLECWFCIDVVISNILLTPEPLHLLFVRLLSDWLVWLWRYHAVYMQACAQLVL